ncbi:MAG: hypothetical protein ACKOTB_13740, partial [Planctomycetia bacterium]
MAALAVTAACAAGPFELTRRRQLPADAPAAHAARLDTVTWEPRETAVIVCDVWDQHHCRNAVDRLGEFAPRIAAVCAAVRQRGGTVIHAPSDCMPAYADHPARRRVLDLVAKKLPAGFEPAADAAWWCSALAAELDVDYPLDQSLGGEDADPARHAAWSAELVALGRNPGMPWKTQSALVPIDPEADFVSDRGDEVSRVLASRGVRHVMLVGVHLNMCVLGRPFGLRRMVAAGLDTVLVRDLTDTMYDPAQWPSVDHYTGTDLMIDHVERHVCPTITSDQILGDGRPFTFAGDRRQRAEARRPTPAPPTADEAVRRWVSVRKSDEAGRLVAAAGSRGPVWRRSVLVPGRAAAAHGLVLGVTAAGAAPRAWIDGKPLATVAAPGAEQATTFLVPAELVEAGRPALLVVAVARAEDARGAITVGPGGPGGGTTVVHRHQIRVGTGDGFESMPLPAQFGGPGG